MLFKLDAGYLFVDMEMFFADRSWWPTSFFYRIGRDAPGHYYERPERPDGSRPWLFKRE